MSKREDTPMSPVVAAQAGTRRSTNEYDLTADELAFINAVSAFKKDRNRPFPTLTEILHILLELGYAKDHKALPGAVPSLTKDEVESLQERLSALEKQLADAQEAVRKNRELRHQARVLEQQLAVQEEVVHGFRERNKNLRAEVSKLARQLRAAEKKLR